MFPLPLLSVAEQLYRTAISAGWGKEDDCMMTRLYLPNGPALVHAQTLISEADFDGIFPVYYSGIEQLLIAVHFAVISEAMSFCEKLGIDTNIMFDIVSNAAGSSTVFHKSTFEAMQKENWSLAAISNADSTQDILVNRLVSMMSPANQRSGALITIQSRSVSSANAIGYPVFLSSAALQEFCRQLPRGKPPVN